MARYKQRPYQARRSSGKRGTTAIPWGWLGLCLGLFMGILGAATVYQAFSTQNTTPERGNPNLREHHPASSPGAKGFEFYQTLPNMQVKPKQEALSKTSSSPKESRTPPHSPRPAFWRSAGQKSKTAHTSKTLSTSQKGHHPPNMHAQYIIQVGTYREMRAADSLKARLALRGLSSRIQKTKTGDGTKLFRVILGPFASESLALSQNKSLTAQKIPGTVILVKSNT